MEEIRSNSYHQNPESLVPNYCICDVFPHVKDPTKINSPVFKEDGSITDLERKDSDEVDDNEASLDSVLCVSGSRLIPSGFVEMNCTEDLVRFVNAGGGALEKGDSSVKIDPDNCFQGGNVLRTDMLISDGGDYPSLYQSARFGNFSYWFQNLSCGDYFVDLHFVEMVNTNGPKGMRVFDVFMQEEKVLSELDIYSVVGANKPLQLVDARVPVGKDGAMIIRFEGVHGSPIVSGICIRRAPKLLAPWTRKEHIICNNCAAVLEVSSEKGKVMQMKLKAKYEKKVQELSTQCQLKTDECYQAWMSLTAANEQLEKVRMELHNKMFQTLSLDQALEKQAAALRDVSSQYKHDKKFWVVAVNTLEKKIKAMKQEHSQLAHEAHECADSIPDLSKMVIAVQALVAQCEDLKVKYSEEQDKRKKLYNQVQEAKGNIRVFCRCRPLSKEEVLAGYATIVDLDAAKDGELGILTGGSTKKTFKFDRVYTPKDDQVDVFADASPLVTSVLDGYNVCIFAYGQTGTGKTFTMEGTEQNRGVNYRTLEQLFKVAKERSDTFTYNLSVSVLEVYNEQIRDLLATSPKSKRLEIRQASEGVHHVPGIVEAKIENIKEVWDVLQAGSNARAVGSNNVNEHSSRSHCMLCIMVRARNLMNGECTKSKLWLVDLAGSERLAKTDVQGERLKEAQNINRSLSALGDVISALATKSSHIPFRNSKLTHLLQDSLVSDSQSSYTQLSHSKRITDSGGDSKTLMFVQISPSEQDSGETLSSLNFATRVRGIELGPAKKQIDTGEIQKMKAMLDKVRQESRSKDESLRKMEENIENLESKGRGKDQLCRNQQDKIRELDSQLESKMELQAHLEKQLRQLSDRLREREELCQTFQQKVKELENKQREREKSDSNTFQQKVNELENKLKDRVQESESQSVILQQKVHDLENKLKDRDDNSESLLLRQKIKELEDKLRQHEMTEHALTHSADKLGATPTEGKAWLKEESINESDPQILRSSNSVNRPIIQESVLLRGTESLRELRRKRDSRNGETENDFILSTSLLEKKILPCETKKVRQIDPSKAFSRLTRTRRPFTALQRPFSSGRISKDQQVQGIKEKDNRTRMWSR